MGPDCLDISDGFSQWNCRSGLSRDACFIISRNTPSCILVGATGGFWRGFSMLCFFGGFFSKEKGRERDSCRFVFRHCGCELKTTLTLTLYLLVHYGLAKIVTPLPTSTRQQKNARY